MTEQQNEIEGVAAPEAAVDWEKARKGKTFRTHQGRNRLKVFKETYKGMPYEIHVVYHKELEDYKEYDHGMWATLEQPKRMQELYQAIGNFLKKAGAIGDYYDEDFCFGDTADCEGVGINERIQEMRQLAHSHIDLFYEYLEKSGEAMNAVNVVGKIFESALKTEGE